MNPTKAIILYIIMIVLMVVLVGIDLANCQEMPKYLKGAEIKVILKNGKTHTFKSEEYAVVKRDKMLSGLAVKELGEHLKSMLKTRN